MPAGQESVPGGHPGTGRFCLLLLLPPKHPRTPNINPNLQSEAQGPTYMGRPSFPPLSFELMDGVLNIQRPAKPSSSLSCDPQYRQGLPGPLQGQTPAVVTAGCQGIKTYCGGGAHKAVAIINH